MNVIDSVTPAQLLMDFDGPETPEFNATGSAAPDSLEYLPSGGDSGGGVFLAIEGGLQLVAINGTLEIDVERLMSHGWYGTLLRLNRVSTATAWIDSTIRSTSTKPRGRTEPPARPH